MKRHDETPATPVPSRAFDRVVMRAIADLSPYIANARTHSPEQIEQIARSIVEFGFVNPVLVDSDGGIIAGHGRVLAAESLGMREVPTLDVHWLTPAQRRAYVLADNQLALNAGWDEAMLRTELASLDQLGFDLPILGFSDDELTRLLDGESATTATVPTESERDADVIPPTNETPVSRAGDLWVLGRHRLMCGDSRNAADVRRLVNAPVNLAFTSPPYAKQRTYDEASGFLPIEPDHYVEWFRPVSEAVAQHLAPDGSFFINIKPSAEGLDTSLYVFDLVIAHVRRWGWHFATEFCWERPGVPKSVTQRFKNQFEPVYQFVLGRWKMRPESVRHPSDNVPRAAGPGAGNTTWKNAQGDLNSSGGVSGTMKGGVAAGLAFPGNRLPTFNSSHEALGHTAAFPVGLPAWFMKAYSDEGDAVYDPFMGSGSTLIAAEQEQRACFGMEISPVYCDVIVKRWQAYTGESAIHVESGMTFDDLREHRSSRAEVAV
jgi:DNA modification methylase